MEMRLSVNTAVHSRRFVLSVINHFFPPVYFFRRINAVQPVRIEISMPAAYAPAPISPILGREGKAASGTGSSPISSNCGSACGKLDSGVLLSMITVEFPLSRSWPPDEPPEPVDGGCDGCEALPVSPVDSSAEYVGGASV